MCHALFQVFRRLLIACFVVLLLPRLAYSCDVQIRIDFVEATPDLFRIEFQQGAAWSIESVRIDLQSSEASVYVDTLYGAPKVTGSNVALLDRLNGFAEGQQIGTMLFNRFHPGQTFDLLVDLDDRGPGDDMTYDQLNGGEMTGTEVTVKLINSDGSQRQISGTFDRDSNAILGDGACV